MLNDHEIEVDEVEVDEPMIYTELVTVFDYQIMLIGSIPDLNKHYSEILEHLYLRE